MDRTKIVFVSDAEFTFPFDDFIARAVIDEQAPALVEQIVRSYRPSFLDFVLQTHDHPDGRKVVVRNHINLVLLFEDGGKQIHGLIFAELEAGKGLARLHVIYVPRAYRRHAVAKKLLVCFDDVLHTGGYNSVITCPVNHVSQRMFIGHQQRSPHSYTLYPTDEATLATGDARMDES
ncbi:MAG: hypothetical protein U0136_21875 [Bdellovibrionota bacterium]